MEREIFVNLGKNSYYIHIEKGLIGSLGEEIKKVYPAGKVFIVTDQNVDQRYGSSVSESLRQSGFPVWKYAIPPGEESKNLRAAETIYGELLSAHITRNDLIIALGGGVVGDLCGFAASTFLRGVSYVQIPTTLLAQVDSSVGGKVAVDLPQGKNLVGSFYQPKAVYIDPSVLDTLPGKYFRDGMGEVIKCGCIRDESFLSLLESLMGRERVMERIEDIVWRCCDLKRQIVEADEQDKGNRMILNFGHTLGHAIETLSGYSGFSHGEGVSIGMYEITRISEHMGLTEPGVSGRIKKILEIYGLPYRLPDMDKEELLKSIGNDKKNLGSDLNVILLEKAGKAFIYQTDVGFFR